MTRSGKFGACQAAGGVLCPSQPQDQGVGCLSRGRGAADDGVIRSHQEEHSQRAFIHR